MSFQTHYSTPCSIAVTFKRQYRKRQTEEGASFQCAGGINFSLNHLAKTVHKTMMQSVKVKLVVLSPQQMMLGHLGE